MSELVMQLEDVRTYFYSRAGFFKTVTVKAVDGVSLTIKRGETVGVVGESGSGKTTLGKTSLKLIPLHSGKVIFNGRDISKYKGDLKWFRKQAQIVFQDPFMALNPFMSIKDILEEPLVIHKVGGPEEHIDIVSKALEEVRLTPPEEFLLKFPHMLSGGQRQRVVIARALVLEPIYMVADEPVSMIDASSRAEILYLFKEIQQRHKMGIMYITHDLATTKYFSDYIAVMYAGKIVEYGSIRKVVENPLHPYTVALLNAVPDPDPSNRFRLRDVIPGEPPSPVNPPKGCRFHPRCPKRFDPCDREEPKLREIENGHYVACHLY